PGSYIPEAHYLALERPTQTLPLVQPLPRAPTHHNWTAIAGSGLVLCTFLTFGSWLLLRPTSLDRFWAPVLAGKIVLVCLGQPICTKGQTGRFARREIGFSR